MSGWEKERGNTWEPYLILRRPPIKEVNCSHNSVWLITMNWLVEDNEPLILVSGKCASISAYFRQNKIDGEETMILYNSTEVIPRLKICRNICKLIAVLTGCQHNRYKYEIDILRRKLLFIKWSTRFCIWNKMLKFIFWWNSELNHVSIFGIHETHEI